MKYIDADCEHDNKKYKVPPYFACVCTHPNFKRTTLVWKHKNYSLSIHKICPLGETKCPKLMKEN